MSVQTGGRTYVFLRKHCSSLFSMTRVKQSHIPKIIVIIQIIIIIITIKIIIVYVIIVIKTKTWNLMWIIGVYSRTLLPELIYFKLPLISKWKNGPCFNMKLWQQNKVMWKRGKLRSNFSSFPHYFIYIFLTSGVKLHSHLLNVVVQFIVFLTLSTLICRGTDLEVFQ